MEDNPGAMLKVALRDLLGDPHGWKEGRRDAKIGSMRKVSLALEKGCFNYIRQCPAPQGAVISTEGMKSSTKGTRNLNVFVGW